MATLASALESVNAIFRRSQILMKDHPDASHRHAVYRITHDVTGEAYKILLEAALNEASTFSLVWREFCA